MSAIPSSTGTQKQFRCHECGADLNFDPGTQSLKCSHCGAINAIIDSTGSVDEEDFVSVLRTLRSQEPTHEQLTYKCTGCAAESVFPPDVTAGTCPFCGCAVNAEASSKKSIKPRALLPFGITSKQAGDLFHTWVASLWFAPSELKKRAQQSAIHGAYLPAWTYDTKTISTYTGERGEHYWETETYTETENNQTVTKTRQVQKTRWWPAAGRVSNSFDDLLVMASQSLPPKLLSHLEPWDLPNLVPFADGYLSGFVAESYQVNLEQGFELAKGQMDGPIRRSITRDIGGDEQRIISVDTQYNNIRFRHLLLPVWISAYRFGETVYRFLVNARTGEVRGERPYSWIKITLLVVTMLIIIVGVILYSQSVR
jgi:LSD1 subclass zinc finger protein